MNTSRNTLLSAEQLELFLQNKLSAEESQRVQHLLDDCELSREALEGYKLVPGALADLDFIKKEIAAKSGMSSMLNAWTAGIGIVAIAGIVITLSTLKGPAVMEKTEIISDPDAHLSLPAAPENPLSPSDDHFVNPEAKTVAVTVPMQKQITKDSAVTVNVIDTFIEAIVIPSENPVLLNTEPVVPKKPEANYNAQVGFIVDLKVTNYDLYYKDEIAVRDLPLTGTPAKYETEDGIGDSKEEKDDLPVRMVPADQFLREGLLAFRDGRYGRCIGKMETLLEHNPDDINALFYTAVSYVKLEMYSKAIPLLDKIISAENNVFDEEAEWYKALALEGNGDSDAAQSLFVKILDRGGFYAKQAEVKLR
jgi:hypothetical protein